MPAAVARGMLFLAFTGLSVLLASGSAEAQPASQTPDVRLTLAVMGLGERPAVAKVGAVESPPPRPGWRHTFGAERKTKEVVARLPKAGFAADVIALRGVTGPTQARQAFPADEYHLVFSRQLLRPDTVTDAAGPERPPVTTTAVAVARRSDLRVIGQDHLLSLSHGPSGAQVPLSAGTAVRVLVGSRAIWVLSVELADGCVEATPERSTSASCEAWEMQLTEVARWLAAKHAAGEAALVAGVFHRALERNELPEALANLPRASGQSHAADCTKPGGDMASTYVLLKSPNLAAPEDQLSGHWTFGSGETSPAEAPCVLSVDLVGR